ncbi:hypothetical protein MMC12_001974 [Toensbergia leucococca]|nr:hypothetical protein [Toensbergia leucococca]
MASQYNSRDRRDSFVALSRQEGHLQRNLQSLIDAQSDGLLAGLGRASDLDDTSSPGSRTPTSGSKTGGIQKPQSNTPVRQPVARKIGLRGARRGISRAIRDLAVVKHREGKLLEAELEEREEASTAAEGLKSRREGLEGKIEGIRGEGASLKVKEYREEESVLDGEITELETRLWEMKARQRRLLAEIEGLDNSVQSKLSSYNEALILVEKQTKDFLARPPIASPTYSNGEGGFWELPVHRRTLEIASEQWLDEQQKLRSRSADIRNEKDALEDGLLVWDDVINTITVIENLLQEQIHQTPPSSPTGKGPLMRDILHHMNWAIPRLESKLHIAETRGWKLLVCCIGAELGAFVEGRDVLAATLGVSSGAGGGDRAGSPFSGDGDGHHDARASQNGNELVDFSRSDARTQGLVDRSEDDDDEPGPELLVSHQDE